MQCSKKLKFTTLFETLFFFTTEIALTSIFENWHKDKCGIIINGLVGPKVIDFINGSNQAEEVNHKANKTNSFDSCKPVGAATKKLVEIKVETHVGT